jgi:AcrR family transcriptional regulator
MLAIAYLPAGRSASEDICMSTRGSATVGKREASGTRVDAIIEAALQLFLERGYDNTPLSAVAERLGLTKAGVYHHFATKEDLLFMAHRRTMERQLIPLLDEADVEPDPEQRLRKFIFAHARMLALEPTAGLLIREARRLEPKHLAEIKKSWRRGLNVVRDSIAELQASGRCRTDINPTQAAFGAIGMTNWIPFWFDPKRPQTADTVARAMETLFMDGLLHGSIGRPDPAQSHRISAVRLPPRRNRRESSSARKRPVQ